MSKSNEIGLLSFAFSWSPVLFLSMLLVISHYSNWFGQSKSRKRHPLECSTWRENVQVSGVKIEIIFAR